MDDETKEKIENLLKENKVVLFMKGIPTFPQCGFSARVVQILKKNNINFGHFNVLEDDAVRQGIKEFSGWPTIPQLYVDGELIGGCDILVELDENGELEEIFG